ncbi:MAG: hypothetical protein IJV31_07850 [Clostridia bacterium]|nr:hypothetical protein [Clostridia bacterium]
MNKTNMILICVTIALISGIIGFIIGINFKGNNEINSSSVSMKNEERNLVGTYKTNTWNGKEAVIALKSDKTMICPNGSGTWSFEDGKLYIEYDFEVPQITEDGRQEYKKSHNKQEVTIVESGLMLSGHFFEKINK